MFVWAGGPIEKQMREYGASTICLEANKLGTLKAGAQILRYYQREKVDIIVVHGSPLLRFLSLIIKKFNKNIRIYFYCHADMSYQLDRYRFPKKQIFNMINDRCIKNSERVIAISEYVKRSILKYYKIHPNKISVVYNAINYDMFNRRIHVPEDTIKFVFVGRLVEVKGVQIAMRAIREIPKTIRWQFNIIGDGEYREELEKLSVELGINDNIVFWGNRNNISEILSKMDIFLHVCTCEEGFGIGIIEAMAAGKLCICSNSGAIPEIITHGKDGFLVDKGDMDNLNKLVLDIINQRKQWHIYQTAAKLTAQRFKAEKFAEELDALLCIN